MHTPLRLALVGMLGLLGSCINAEAPLNPFAVEPSNGISGTVLVDGVQEPGNVIITVFSG